ncbi:MAG: YdcF family protein, partial [Desulfobacterales bacterium]
EQKVAPKILVLSPNWQVIGTQKRIGEFIVEDMITRGIPRDSIFLDYRPDSTYEDAIYSREWALKLGVTSLIVLEDPFGMRRLRWTFRKVFANTDIQLYYVSVPPELSKLTVEKWWTRETELLYVFEEYVKLVFYWIKY